MNHTRNMMLGAVMLCGILTAGCGDTKQTAHAEHPQTTAAASSAAESGTDRDHALYEEDDVHRRTETEPDLLDRADSAMDSAEKLMTEAISDAKKHLEEMR